MWAIFWTAYSLARFEEESMSDRPCDECVWFSAKYGSCTQWDCKALTRSDLRKLLKKLKELEERCDEADG